MRHSCRHSAACRQATELNVQYVTLQLQGHHELLGIQNGFLQVQPSMSSDAVHIAMLARTTIQMHLVLLEELRQTIGEA